MTPVPAATPPWGLAELCGAVAAFAITLMLAVQLMGPADPTDAGTLMLAHLPAHLVAIAAILVLGALHGAPGRAALGLRLHGLTRQLLAGLAAYAGFLLLWVPLVFLGYTALLHALGLQLPEQATMRWLLEHRDARWFPVLLVVVAGTGPVMEECFFRGLLQPYLVARLGVLPGILATAALFGAMHDPPQYLALPIGLIGVFLGLVRHRTGSLLVPAALHALHNALMLAVCLSAPHLYQAVYR